MRPFVALLSGAALYAAAGAAIPFSWTHTLSESCYWLPASPWDDLGLSRGEPGYDENVARAACFNKRGGFGVDVRDVLRVWPDKAWLTALRSGK